MVRNRHARNLSLQSTNHFETELYQPAITTEGKMKRFPYPPRPPQNES